MEFKDSGTLEKFSDEIDKFTSDGVSESSPTSILKHKSDQKTSRKHGKSDQLGKSTNTQIKSENQASGSETDYADTVQSDTIPPDSLQEQITRIPSTKGKKETIDRVLFRGGYKHYSREDKSLYSEFVDKTSLFNHDKSKSDRQEKSSFIYYDLKEKGDDDFYGKMAYREIFTNTAGGARFESHYTEDGKLISEVTLFKGKERTDNKGFRNKSIQFIDRTGKAVELFSPKENETVASTFDEETEIVFEAVADRTFEKANRFREIEKETKTERKKIEREIKKSRSETFSDSDSLFQKTSSVFENKVERFESYERIFRRDISGSAETSIFVESTSSTTKSLPDKTEIENAVRFSNQIDSNGNNRIRSVDSYFTEESTRNDRSQSSGRFMSKEDRLEQAKSKEKAAKEKKNEELKKAAATTAVAKMLNAKKNIQNQFGDMSGQGTGDLIKDGSGGLVQTFASAMKHGAAYTVKAAGSAVWKCIGSALCTLLVPILIFIVCFLLIASVVSSIGSDSGAEYDMNVTGDGLVYASLSDEEIDNIITALYDNYYDMTLDQEMVLKYSLSKVGCAYNQAYHGNLSVDIFDCSSLAYRSYLQAGIDISNGGIYTAAAECLNMVQTDKLIDGDLKPGDLFFYGGSDNGRYLGVYHVAIYVGNIDGVDKMVEARGKSSGVVYCDVRTNNVVKIARPYA